MVYDLNRGSRNNKQYLLVGVALLVGLGVGTGLMFSHRHRTTFHPAPPSPVPANISKAVNFPIYYPEQAKLPIGYHLDTASFASPVKNGVNYSVTYGSGQKIVFSVQAKPSDTELQTFNSSYIPLKVDYQTPVGQSEIGAYHNQTLVSLPVINGPWIVITAPPDINQIQLKQVLSSLKH